MSEYKEYAKEKKQIDDLLTNGFYIRHAYENFNGSVLTFSHTQTGEVKQLIIGNADARKYFSNVIINQKEKNFTS